MYLNIEVSFWRDFEPEWKYGHTFVCLFVFSFVFSFCFLFLFINFLSKKSKKKKKRKENQAPHQTKQKCCVKHMKWTDGGGGDVGGNIICPI